MHRLVHFRHRKRRRMRLRWPSTPPRWQHSRRLVHCDCFLTNLCVDEASATFFETKGCCTAAIASLQIRRCALCDKRRAPRKVRCTCESLEEGSGLGESF